MHQKKIAVIGSQCAGKTTVCEIIAAMHEMPFVIKFADPIYDCLRAYGCGKNRAFMQGVGELANKLLGQTIHADIFSRRMSIGLKRFHDIILCDDVRRDYEAETALKCGFDIIFVDADREVRKRRSEDQGIEFIENDISETQVSELEKYACVKIVNNSGIKADLEGPVMSALSVIAADVLPVS